jgi:alkylation response protein AidB-like acyl-CoA dehydrogenase
MTSPARSDLVATARSLVPLIREAAGDMDRHRRLSDHVVSAVRESGLLRMRVPAQYGGYESDLGTVLAVTAELGRADLSTAWVVSSHAISSWLAAVHPDAAQDEVFARPGTMMCAVLSPTASAEPAPGGWTVTGRWAFASGAWHSDWAQLVAIAPGPDSTPTPLSILVPMGDLGVVDDWDTVGMRATGSVSLTADRVFVPAHRTAFLPPMLQDRYASERNADKPVYRVPAVAGVASAMTGPLLGTAQAAMETFLERLPGHGITYTAYEEQSQAATTHLTVADAAMLVGELRSHAERAANLLDAKAAAGEPVTLPERVEVRAAAGRVALLARQAVSTLAMASGASSIRSNVPMQRLVRDVQALSLHALIRPDTTAELYGRILVGLPPNTPFV